MQSRNVILVAALAFIGVLAALTVVVAVRNGPDILTVASLLVLAMLASGIVGALRHPPHQ